MPIAMVRSVPPLPRRSPGILWARLDDQYLAYDLATETAHLLNTTGGALLSLCDGVTDLADGCAALVEATGAAAAIVRRDVSAALDSFAQLGLVDRVGDWSGPPPPRGASDGGSAPGCLHGQVHSVVDHRIVFRGAQADLLAEIDAHLGTTAPGRPATIAFDVHEEDDGIVVLLTDDEWRFPSRQALLDGLATVVNEYAARSHSCLTLHAGAVRSPAGKVVVLAAPSGAGKSTLTAACVLDGWDYLGDEAIGVRAGSLAAVGYPKRLAIDAGARRVLALPASRAAEIDPHALRPGVARLFGPVGPVACLAFPRYVPGADLAVEDLTVTDAALELLANAFNLARVGQPGLDTICQLARGVRARRLTHSDVFRAVGALAVT